MVSKRIIPCLDVDNGRVVKGTNFVEIKDAGDPVELARLYYEQGADELCFLDITASHEERKATYDVISRTAKEVFIPLTVGGGVNSIEDGARLVQAGADKVGVNSGAVKRPELLTELATHLGSQSVVLAVDVKFVHKANLGKEITKPITIWDIEDYTDEFTWEVYVRGGRTPTGIEAIDWIKRGVDLGAGEILLTSMDGDGSKKGYDLEITRRAAEAVTVPIIASGGAGSTQHIVDAFQDAKADAALLASLLHFKELTIDEIKAEMLKSKIDTRF